MSSYLLCEKKNHIGYIILNRPDALHALNHQMIVEFSYYLEQFEQDSSVESIVIKATPSRAFCAGGDIRALFDIGQQYPDQAFHFFEDEYALNLKIGTLTKPYIALMNGYTLGGGVGISLHGPYPIATEHFRFGMPETTIGFFPDIGSSHLFGRLPIAYANYLALTGQHIGPEEALYLKLIYGIIAEKDLSVFEAQLNEKGRSAALSSVRRTHTAPCWFEAHHELINTCFAQPSIDNIDDALRKANTPWAIETRNLLRSKSPTSLQVTFELLKRTRGQSLAQCLMLDRHLVQSFLKSHDLYEGIRAQLIDKDKSPQWQPNVIPYEDNRALMLHFFL